MPRKCDGGIKTKRSKKKNKSRKTHDKFGKYSQKHLRMQEEIVEKTKHKRTNKKGKKKGRK